MVIPFAMRGSVSERGLGVKKHSYDNFGKRKFNLDVSELIGYYPVGIELLPWTYNNT